ncbi:uncharacterized protein BcabD6B2_18640 [Babesia caballi]|uniref:Uncharacterized protein n=1 Tax=Babesia caballi TaxID=5871 RepID=A0AAV4LUW5_BABCB|nr:hypothetical protein, conserved [Babesia caballi]
MLPAGVPLHGNSRRHCSDPDRFAQGYVDAGNSSSCASQQGMEQLGAACAEGYTPDLVNEQQYDVDRMRGSIRHNGSATSNQGLGHRISSEGVPRVPTLDLTVLGIRSSLPLSSLGEHDQAPPPEAPQGRPQLRATDDIVAHLRSVQTELERKLSSVRLQYQAGLSSSVMSGSAKKRTARLLSMTLSSDESLSLCSSSSVSQLAYGQDEGYSASNAVGNVTETGRGHRLPMPQRFVPPDWGAPMNGRNGLARERPSDPRIQTHKFYDASTPTRGRVGTASLKVAETKGGGRPPPARCLTMKGQNRRTTDVYNTRLLEGVVEHELAKTMDNASGNQDNSYGDHVELGLATESDTRAELSETATPSKTDGSSPPNDFIGKQISRAYSFVDRLFNGKTPPEDTASKPPSATMRDGQGNTVVAKTHTRVGGNGRGLQYREGFMPATLLQPSDAPSRVESPNTRQEELVEARSRTGAGGLAARPRAVDYSGSRSPRQGGGRHHDNTAEDTRSYEVVSVSGSEVEQVSKLYDAPMRCTPSRMLGAEDTLVERNVDERALTHLPTSSGNHVKGIAGYSLEYLNQLSKAHSKCALLRHRELDTQGDGGYAKTGSPGRRGTRGATVTPWFHNPLAEKAWRHRARKENSERFLIIPNHAGQTRCARQPDYTMDSELKRHMEEIATYRLDLEEHERHGVIDPFYEYERARENRTRCNTDWARYGRPLGRR